MKPDDILSAIGDVDEKYVRRAHRKDCIRAFAASAFTLAILVAATGFLMEPDYVLTRMTPDFEVNTGYIDPDALMNEHWTTMEYTSFCGEGATESTVIARAILGNYKISHTNAEGDVTVLVGAVKGEYIRCEYLKSEETANFYLASTYNKDAAGRVDSIVIHGKHAYEGGNQLLNYLKLEYFGNGMLVKQTKQTDDQVIGYRILDYENSRISKTSDYDAEGMLLEYTDYIYDGNMCKTITYGADSQVFGSSVRRYNWFGWLTNCEYYDAAGNLVSQEVYRYRVWERFRSMEGFLILFVMLALAATIGVGVYEDRIRLPQRKSPEENMNEEE